MLKPDMRAFDALSSGGQVRRLKRLAAAALQRYDLPVRRIVPVQHESNTTFRIETTTGERYVLRIQRPDAQLVDATRSEALWLEALRRDTDLAVPEPIRNCDGDFVTIAVAPGVPERRTCVLFRWLDGRFVDQRLTPAHLHRVGVLTATLHQHAAHWQPPANFCRGRVDHLLAAGRRAMLDRQRVTKDTLAQHPPVDEVERCVRLVADLCSAQNATIVEAVIRRVQATQQELGYSAEMFGLIHADLHQENYFCDRGEIRLIDFDDCGYGHYLFDLGVTLLETQHLPRYEALRTALLEGYRSTRSLPAEHERYLPTFFALRRLQLLFWVLESRDHPAFSDWSEDAAYDLAQLREFLESSP